MNDLVSFSRSTEFPSPCVSSGDHLQSVYPSVRTTTSVPSRQARMYRNGHRKVLCRRLVPHLLDGTKHRLRHFQSEFYQIDQSAAIISILMAALSLLSLYRHTGGRKPTFYLEIPLILIFQIKNVNFVKTEISEL